jgi:hypothetical protein
MAAGTTSLITRAPWLPPNTSSRRMPPAAKSGNGVAAAASTAGRTGFPVCTRRSPALSGSPRTRGNPVAINETRGARKRLARPMTPFCSWMMVGMRRRDAARTGGTVG